MQLTPRYGLRPLIVFEDGVEPGDMLVRQRRRVESTLRELSADEWAAPSRCEGWSVQDVVAHLVGTNRFWAASMLAGAAGSPTELLRDFDPAVTPALMVEPTRSMSPTDVLGAFEESNAALVDAVASLDGAGWDALAEAPPGHVANRLVALHALWDSWVHERDILVPLGRPLPEEPDEIEGNLRYVAALGPSFRAGPGGDPAVVEVVVSEPEIAFVVEVAPQEVRVRSGLHPASGAPRLEGRAVDVLEALSIREVPGWTVPETARWLLSGLADVFDHAPG